MTPQALLDHIDSGQLWSEGPGAADLMAGDVITTGTWTDAWPVQPGEHWTAAFSAPLSPLRVTFR